MMSGVIPALSAPRLDRALVLGFGTGITAGATSRIFKSTDVVEINNAFYKMMPHLSYANLDIENNTSASLHLSDGRAFLVGKEGTYDAIDNSIPAPTYFSASKIYTLEFYDRVVKALKPDGIFCTWLSAGDMSEAGVQVVLSALRHSFRYCDLRVMRGGYCIATCSNQPIKPRRFSDLPVQSNLVSQLQKQLGNLDLDEFFEDTRISENLFDHFTPQVPQENTDDHPVLEFMVVRSFQMGKMGSDPFLTKQALFNIDPVRRDELKDINRLVRRAAVFAQFSPGYFKRNFVPILRKELDTPVLFLLFRAKYFASQGELDKAIKYLTEALRYEPDHAETHYSMANVLASQGKFDKAISHYNQALRIKPDFTAAREKLDVILKAKNKPN